MARPESNIFSRRWGANLIRLASALLLLWAAGLSWFVQAQPGPVPLSVKTDAVVVLTGGAGRTARGIAVLSEGAARYLFVSGVNPRVTEQQFRDADRLPTALLDCCVELGQQAETTRGNALEVADFVSRRRARSIRLVTASYHMRRAQAEIAAALPAGVTLVPDAVPSTLSARGMISEYHKLVAARALLLTGIAR